MNPYNNQRKVLVIDDELHIRQSFADFLEDQEFQVVLAENGRIGLELLEKEKPDIVLLDLRMPEMDGLEVLKQGKSLMPDLPMIVISGANRIGEAVRALRNGAWDYFEKPVQDFSILKHAVERALEKARLIEENRDYQKHLEVMVKERTRELETANKNLSNINLRLHKIVKTTQGLTGCREMKQFGMKMLEGFVKQMAATGGCLYMEEEKGLRLIHSLGSGHAADFIPFPIAEGSVLNRVLEDIQPLLIKRISESDDIKADEWAGCLRGSLLAFPILDSSGSSSMGIILLHSEGDPPFVEQDKEIGSLLASYSCESIRAIKAFEKVQSSEKQLRQSQKMEAIGTLAGGIAHDFNNILSGILGYAQLAEMNIGAPDKIRENIRQLMQGTTRASELVSQILTFSRKAEYEKQALKIYVIIKEAIKFLRSSIPSTIEIVDKVNSKKMVLADATQIHQVVMNLCTNAYHAMRDSGGKLSVSLSDIMLEKADVQHPCSPGPYLELTIEDTGGGIEKEYLHRIFDPYFTTKKISQGTGLGLAVVDGIIKKHNGFIRVSTQLGEGTVFKVYFPVAEHQDQQAARPADSPDYLYGKETVMLVDDEIPILEPTLAILERLGYQVEGYLDGEAALEAFEADPDHFDIIITDMTMPRMSGSELSRRILSIREDIPVFLCTGFHETFTEEKALKMGIRRYVQKPVSGKELALMIREELGAPAKL